MCGWPPFHCCCCCRCRCCCCSNSVAGSQHSYADTSHKGNKATSFEAVRAPAGTFHPSSRLQAVRSRRRRTKHKAQPPTTTHASTNIPARARPAIRSGLAFNWPTPELIGAVGLSQHILRSNGCVYVKRCTRWRSEEAQPDDRPYSRGGLEEAAAGMQDLAARYGYGTGECRDKLS